MLLPNMLPRIRLSCSQARFFELPRMGLLCAHMHATASYHGGCSVEVPVCSRDRRAITSTARALYRALFERLLLRRVNGAGHLGSAGRGQEVRWRFSAGRRRSASLSKDRLNMWYMLVNLGMGKDHPVLPVDPSANHLPSLARNCRHLHACGTPADISSH
jgi:hypothetical protein